MSAVLTERPSAPLRWGLCFAAIAALHVAGLWLALQLRAAAPPDVLPTPAPIIIDLPPLNAPRPAPPRPVPPPPKRVSQPPPKPVALPIVPQAPARHIDVPLPARPPERNVVAAPARPVPDDRPVATAAPQAVEPPPVAATAAPIVPPPAAAPPSNAVPAWQGTLMGKLERFKRYPAAAQFRRQQGVVYLRFAMDRHGKVVSAKIEKSSGFDALDAETLVLIHRAEPLPPPPPEVTGDPVELVVPVQFFLK